MEETFFESSNDSTPAVLQKEGSQENQTAVEFQATTSSAEDVTSTSETTEASQTTRIAENIQNLFTEMSQLRQDFDTKVKYDDSKERLITNLHKELQFYRDGLHFRVLKPMFLDLISLYNDMDKLIDSLYQEASSPDTQQLRHLASFQGTVEEILHRNGVDLFRCEQETFVPSKQRALRTHVTPHPEEDKCIAKRVRPGFEYEGKLLQPEFVEIYKYVAPVN